jgi:hypothetical protein
MTHIYQVEIVQPEFLYDIYRLFDEFLEGCGNFNNQLLGGIPR